MITKFDPEQKVFVIAFNKVNKVRVDWIEIKRDRTIVYLFNHPSICCCPEKDAFRTEKAAELELARRGK